MCCHKQIQKVRLNHEVAQEDFDKLLDWLAHNRDEAGVRFEQIRQGLTRYFRLKGCHDPELLADESMNRVINRIDTLDLMTGTRPTSIFYGFASKVFLEYLRTEKKRLVQLSDSLEHVFTGPGQFIQNPAIDCLRECMKDLSILDGKLIVDYYSEEKQAKFEARRRMAMEKEMAMGALHSKIHRIKGILRPCVEKCLGEKKFVRK